jgi:ceramide glucosyltransferase
MSILLWALLAIALVGSASSTVFLGMALVAAVRHLRRARVESQVAHSFPSANVGSVAGAGLAAAPALASALPPVTILKPLHGAEPQLEENLESFFLQDYPDFEIIFGCRNAADPALAVVERLRARHPRIPVRVVLSGEPEWANAKVWSLDKMIAVSTRDYFVLSDSDILVGPDFLRAVIPPLRNSPQGDPQTGLVTCLYRGVPGGGLWSHLEALGMSVEMPSGVLIADMLEGMRFALGAAIAVRRDALDKIGGIASTREYYSDDFVLGQRVYEAGCRVALSHCRVAHVLCAGSLRQTFATQVRWMQSTRYSRPRGHLGTGLTFAVPFGLLGLIAAAALDHAALGFALFAASVVNRIVQCAVIGCGVIGDRRALGLCWLYPLRDLLGFVVWCASYCTGSDFHWRGELYRFTPGGRIESILRTDHAQPL